MNQIEQLFPDNLKFLYELIFFPINLCKWTMTMPDDGNLWILIAKILFLFIPLLMISVGVFCSVLSLLTVIFRPNRNTYIATVLITWWDGGKSIFNFWAGVFRFLFLAFYWIFGALRIVLFGLVQTLKDIIFLPMSIISNFLKGYSRPGIPWVAFFITLFWICLESMMFAYILTPMVVDIIAGFSNVEPSSSIVSICLAVFLFFFIGGSFASMHGLVEAINEKKYFNIIKMLLIEFIVMLVEVVFFYREFVSSLAPWFAQMTNDTYLMGGLEIIVFAGMAWLGVRASTWFFFARFGTPTLLMIISREGLSENKEKKSGLPVIGAPLSWIKEIVDEMRGEVEWFAKEGERMVSSFVLPPVQLLAVITNFFMVLLTGKNLFNIPVKSLDELKDTRQLIEEIMATGPTENNKKK